MPNVVLNNKSTLAPSAFSPNPILVTSSLKGLIQELKDLNNNKVFKPRADLVQRLNIIEAQDLSQVLHSLFSELTEKNELTNVSQFLDRLTSVIPLEKLQESVQGDVQGALREVKERFEEAKSYLQVTDQPLSAALKTRLSNLLDHVCSVIEGIINTFGIADFFNPSVSDAHADFKSQKIIGMLLLMLTTVSGLLIPLVGPALGVGIIGGVLLGIAALSFIWPLIKPMPTYLPANAENWTKQVQQGGFVAHGRKESLDQIANVLKMNRHPIIVGPSRVGKSLTVKAFAQAVERGDYPELKGKVIFRLNAADLLSQQPSMLIGGGKDILKKISNAMGRHRENIILVIDEIHMACREEIADQMKTFLDEGGEFAHVIGITTDKEYDKHILGIGESNNGNLPFSLRFDRIGIENTNEDETLEVLANACLKDPARPLLEAGALQEIYHQTASNPEAPQPSASLRLLRKCVQQTGKSQRSEVEKKIVALGNRMRSLTAQSGAYRGSKEQEVLQLKKELDELKQSLAKEKGESAKLFQSKELLNQVTQEKYGLILKIGHTAQKKLTSKTEKQLKRFVLLNQFLEKALESQVKAKAQELGVKVVIDQQLIQEVAHV